MNGCKNVTELDVNDAELHVAAAANEADDSLDRTHDPMVDDVVVVRRLTQTVRAIEPRSGGERWNFSVGHHDLEILRPSDCHDSSASSANPFLDLQLKVIVPDGIVCAFHKDRPNVLVWQYKFDHPIVSAWKNDKNQMVPVDLFSFAAASPLNGNDGSTFTGMSASVYVGMFNKQLYIQESDSLRKITLNKHLDEVARARLQIPWNPYPASKTMPLIEAEGGEKDERSDNPVTGLSVLYGSEYVNGNGFFLFAKGDYEIDGGPHCDGDSNETDDDGTSDADKDGFNFPFDEDATPAKIIIVSLWFWW